MNDRIFGYIVEVHIQKIIMATFDIGLAVFFGTLSAVSLLAAVLCFRKALKVSGERDGDFKMFLWAVGSLIGMIIATMSVAYILLPILFHYT